MEAKLENKQIDNEESVYEATYMQLVWRRFKKHRLALISITILLIIYLISIFCGFFAPYDPGELYKKYSYAPPQTPHFVTEEGDFHLRPFVYGYKITRDPVSLKKIFKIDKEQVYPLNFLVRGHQYKLLGIWKTNIHFFGIEETEEATMFFLGTDRSGRDMFSRILYGGRISTSIGFVGVFLSLLFGITIGGFSGYYGGIFDTIVQRLIEFLRSIPTIPLWMGLSAALPKDWSQVKVYFGITIILSLVGWTGLARQVRSKFISLREEDFIVSAQVAGSSESRIVFKHMLPSFLSHIIATITLAIPQMILGETSLSFLGIGLRDPVISWGVLLQRAQNIRTVALYPWLLLPGFAVIVVVLAFNFLGDGLRDAADPYGL